MNGLFFEAVQRDGYRGFGAANASVRMAAQARVYDQELDFAVTRIRATADRPSN